MYQFEASSTNASNAAVTAGVQYCSYASVASATSCRVRSTSHASSCVPSAGSSARLAYDGSKPSMFA
jgi:hypothetical protein